MRDIGLTLFFVFVLFYAVRHTWIGFLLWTWLSLMNPHRLTYGFANGAPFALVTALATLISLPLDRKSLRLSFDPTVAFLVMFVVWMCVTTYFAIFPDQSSELLVTNLKIQLMTLVGIMALRERRQIEAFIWVIVFSVGFYGVKGGIFTIATGGSGRVWGPPDSYLFGNNELGLALTMIIPLMYYLRLVSPRPWVRRGLLVAMLLSAAAALGTQSRGAMLAIAAMTLVLWSRSQKKILVGVVLAVLASLLVAFMPASWDARMRTIETYEEDGSAMGRINAWQTAINIANDRITGGGYAIQNSNVFQRYSPRPDVVLTAHSIYFQAIGEQGWIGFGLFVGIGATAFWTCTRMRRRAKEREEARWLYELSGMLQVSMVGYAVGGAFLSLAYLDLAYDIAVIIVTCNFWLKEQRWQTEFAGFFGSGAPLGRLPAVPVRSAGGAQNV